MDLAETVTFGGSARDRLAERRADAQALTEDPRARHLALWRGKLLMADDGSERLGRDAALLAQAAGAPVFLGDDGGAPVFAHDVSAWWPPEGLPDTLGAFADLSRQSVPGLPESHVFCELRSVMSTLDPHEAELAATAKAVLGWHATHRFCARCGAATDAAEGGWQRVCPACGGRHFPRTDPVVIMLITKGNAVLVGRSHGWPEGMYSLLAGFVEPGETIEAAVRREVAEETGIAVGRVGYLASQPWPFPMSLMIGCRGEALDAEIRLDETELEDALWVGREEMLQVFAGNHPGIRPPRRGAIAGFIVEHWLKDRLD